MPIKTDIESSPYFDDFDQNNDYYRVLFKPSVPVQVRELNQVQSVLQNQIEKVGDNLYKRGSIIEGCSFTFHESLPYAKLKDTDVDGSPLVITQFPDLLVKNPTTNLHAQIIASNTGFESQAPDLNTIYLKYLNSGTSQETEFSSSDELTIFDADNALFEVSITNGSSGFANTDAVLFLSSITVQNSTLGTAFTNSSGQACTFSAGQTITGGSSNASVVIVSVDTTSNADAIILNIRPEYADLSADPANTASWSLSAEEFVSVNNGVIDASLSTFIGTGATATLVTDGSGTVTNINIIEGGTGYYVPPYVNIISTTGAVSTIDLTAENYFSKATVASVANSIGNGYGISVSNGVVYQAGHFQRVDEQFAVVEKYSNSPDARVVGFDTAESIVDSNLDESLLDNALGTFNYTAPGADRLQLTPVITVLDANVASANSDFLPLVEFYGGRPVIQRKVTEYNAIEDEIARRTFDESGNYVTDPFLVTSISANSMALEANSFDIVVDPGKGYIQGYRVETFANYQTNIQKSTNTETLSNVSVALNFGNYIRVSGLAGVFLYTTGDTVSLRDTAKNFLDTGSNYGSTPTAAGDEIGTARIRSLVFESGVPGDDNAIYRLYLFDTVMDAGKNFRNVRSIFYDGASFDAVADVVLELDETTGTNIARTRETANNRMAFTAGAKAVKSINTVSFTYKTLDQTSLSANAAGIVTISLTGTDTFPYTANDNLSSAEKYDIHIVPTANGEASSAVTGTITVNTTSSNVIGSSTTFLTDFEAGDYVKISANATGGTIYRRVESITNNTLMTLDSNGAFANASATLTLAFPQYIPIPTSTHSRTINVDSSGQVLKIDLNETMSGTFNVAVGYNVKVSNAAPITKTANRNLVVRLDCSNATGNTLGPWCLGVPDIFRLRNVYKGTNNTFLSTDSDIIDVTRHFVIDHNQNQNEYDVGFLYIKPGSDYTLSSSDRLLVKFDAYTNNATNTFFSVDSYTIDDTANLSSLTTSVNTLEIPEYVSYANGQTVDLRDVFDFRPVSANTATLTSTEGSATVHPSEPTRSTKYGNTADPTNDQKFPAPDTDATFNIEYYLGRKDLVSVLSNGSFLVTTGQPALEPVAPSVPENGLVVELLNIPPYPSLPEIFTANTGEIALTRVINQKTLSSKRDTFTVAREAEKNPTVYSQTPGFTMQDIKNLSDRLAALEYYSTLSLLEDKTKNEVIPSSANTQLDRYKFGYFVDNFTTDSYIETADSEFKASIDIETSRLVPQVKQINLKYRIYDEDTTTANSSIGKALLLPYESVSVIAQTTATLPDPGVTTTTTTTGIAPRASTPSTGAVRPVSYKGRFLIKTPSVFRAIQKFNVGTPFTYGILGASIPRAPSTVLNNAFQRTAFARGTNTLIPIKGATSTQFSFTVSGLRPSTRFYFRFDGSDRTSQCTPLGAPINSPNAFLPFSGIFYRIGLTAFRGTGKTGDPLIADKDGVLQFNFLLTYALPIDLVSDKSLLTQPSFRSDFINQIGKTQSRNKVLEIREGSATGPIVARDQLPIRVTFQLL